ncbi:MAG: hypothetical protein CMO55_11325 [Verrucomicrobiales bacterium]|nr:hypothetical protein [Verrucomicrobiales bacterium]
MKTPLVYILALITIASNAQDELPNQFELLKQNYDNAIERATHQITSKYVQELKTMKAQMLEAGNLEIANQADAELTRLGAVESPSATN